MITLCKIALKRNNGRSLLKDERAEQLTGVYGLRTKTSQVLFIKTLAVAK